MPRNAAIEAILATNPTRIGPFRLVAELGEGGFAPVFLATEDYGGAELRTVALKLFALDDVAGAHGAGQSHELARARIVEEARALCRVEHPNVVAFFQLVEARDGKVLGLAMEHVRGRSLDARIGAEGALPVDATLEVGAAVAAALAAVHAAGLVHRDVKPGNVIDAGGVYKLIDFGIATRARKEPRPSAASPGDVIELVSTGPDGSEVTLRASAESGQETDAVAGTMGYIDPACLARGEAADASSDLYALGAMLFECLTGRLPASEGGEVGTITRLRMNIALGAAPAPSVREIAPHVPEAVARIVGMLLSPQRRDRPQRAEWVACELERLRRSQRGAARDLPADGPFRGLEAFDARHRDVYFGRATDVAAALELLRSRGLVALVGPSGSGKSSLARAGVLPAVVDGSLGAWPPQWTTVALSPDAYPRAALEHALGTILDRTPMPDDPGDLASLLAATVETTSVGIIILVDALEELVTLTAADERAYLARFLTALSLRPMPGLRAIVTARRDFLDPLLAEAGLGSALARAVQLVAPLSPSVWEGAVEDRLAAYGFALGGEAMRASLLGELTLIADAMPLAEFGLARLWEHRDVERRVLTKESLVAMGGLSGALARHAESTIDTLSKILGPDAAAASEAVLLALTTPHGTRATGSREQLESEVPTRLRDDVLAALERARIVVSEQGRITIAHEVLITHWPRLSRLVQAARRDREAARDVEEAAARWRKDPGEGSLLRGRRLRDARTLVDSRGASLSGDARALIAASRKHQLRSGAGPVVLIAVVPVLLGVVALSLWEMRARSIDAEKEKTEVTKITKTLMDARNRPQSERERDLEELLVAKHACEKRLERCSPIGSGSVP